MPTIRGVTAAEPLDEQAIYDEAVRRFNRTTRTMARKRVQSIEFKQSPICLTFLSDQHLGGSGTDYERAFREAEIVRDTPRMYAATVGDFLDNFIMPKLMHAHFDSSIPPSEQWVLVEKYLRVIAPKLLIAVCGNHEHWVRILTNISFFEKTLGAIAPHAIYDSDDALVEVRVRGYSYPIRVRHRWKNRSELNDSHGIEKASRFEQDFTIGVGGHWHTSSVARQFVTGARNRMALICGTYKIFDPFTRQRGFPRTNGSAAVSVILNDQGDMIGINRLECAADLIRRYK